MSGIGQRLLSVCPLIPECSSAVVSFFPQSDSAACFTTSARWAASMRPRCSSEAVALSTHATYAPWFSHREPQGQSSSTLTLLVAAVLFWARLHSAVLRERAKHHAQ